MEDHLDEIEYLDLTNAHLREELKLAEYENEQYHLKVVLLLCVIGVETIALLYGWLK